MEIQSFEEWSASRRPQAYMEAGITAEPILNLLPVPEIPKPTLTVYGVMNRYNAEIALNFLAKAFPAYDREALEALVQKTDE